MGRKIIVFGNEKGGTGKSTAAVQVAIGLLRMTDRKGERWLGIYYLICCIVLSNPIPIPFSHNPLAIALSVVALGFVARDGYVIIAGALGAVAGIAINISLTGGALLLGLKLLHLV